MGWVGNSVNAFEFMLYPNWGSNNNNGNLLGAQTYAGGPAPQQSLTVFNDSQYYDAVNRLVASYGKDVNNAVLLSAHVQLRRVE